MLRCFARPQRLGKGRAQTLKQYSDGDIAGDDRDDQDHKDCEKNYCQTSTPTTTTAAAIVCNDAGYQIYYYDDSDNDGVDDDERNDDDDDDEESMCSSH